MECTVHVLLLEDCDADRRFVVEALASGGQGKFFVEHVTTLAAFAERVACRRPDLALVDLCVPDSHDFDTFERVRALLPDAPVVVQTGLEQAGLSATALRNGAQDYLVKGRFDADHLRRAIRYALERWRADRALRESEERYALASRGSNDGIWDWDLREGRLVVSPRWLHLLRLPSDARVGKPETWLARVHPDDQSSLADAISEHLAGKATHLEHEHRIARDDGEYLWVRCRGLAVRDAGDRPTRMAGSMMDISAQRARERDLSFLAHHDSLTGLPNRTLCLERISQAMQRASRGRGSFAVLFVDIDRFKVINDSLGHGAGDVLLVELAARLQQAVRPSDTVARLGGDEFCILVEDTGGDHDGVRVAERIRQLTAAPFVLCDRPVFSSVSVGIAVHSSSHRTPAELLRDADMAMYRAKTQGAGRMRVSDSGLHHAALERLSLETALHRALERRELFLCYQPIVDLRGPALVGVEALVRWQCPERGLVPPSDFVPLAEETGLIVPMGRWVLEEALRQVGEWSAEHPQARTMSVSVNLSPKQLHAADLTRDVFEVLADAGVSPSRLKLEITESSLLDDETVPVLEELHRMGVRIDLDDFGTGFSSLAYLQRLPISTIKIDRSFVDDIELDDANWGIVRAVVGMAAILKKSVVAEGVERLGQWERLLSIGCPCGQGYFFGRPARTFEELTASLARVESLPPPTRRVVSPFPRPIASPPPRQVVLPPAVDTLVPERRRA